MTSEVVVEDEVENPFELLVVDVVENPLELVVDAEDVELMVEVVVEKGVSAATILTSAQFQNLSGKQ